MSRLIDIQLDDSNLPPPTPEIEQERRVAIYDLLEDNSFSLFAREGVQTPPGPYKLHLSIRDRRLVFSILSAKDQPIMEFLLSMGPFRQVVKDYFQICESYFEAVKSLPLNQIETIDMARRGIHDEGSRVVRERLEGKAQIDTNTARRLFTLICVLHFGG